MAQFDVFPNPDSAQESRIPFLLDVQSDWLGSLGTTVIVPLYDAAASLTANVHPVRGLMPILEVEGQPAVMMTPEMAGIPRNRLPDKLASLTTERGAILAALDILVTGV